MFCSFARVPRHPFAICIAAALAGGAALMSAGCDSGCFGLVRRVNFSSDATATGDSTHPVGCCGATAFQDLDLTESDIVEIDLANGRVNSRGRAPAVIAPRDL